MILVTGAGGKTGRALIGALAGTESICAFVHHEGQASALKALGAERVIVGDLRDPAALHVSMQGIRAVYHICPNMNPHEAEIGSLLLHNARKSNVEHFVYHSVLHPQTEKMHHHWQKLRVEESIFESGLSFTILQPAPYLQNLLAGWKSIIGDHVLRVPYSVNAKFSFVDLGDVAQAAKIVLTETGHANAVYELAGTPPISHVDIAAICSQVLAVGIRPEQEEISSWRLRAQHSGMGDYAITNLVRMFEYYDKWGLAGNPNVLGWVIRRVPTSVESFVHRVLNDHDKVH